MRVLIVEDDKRMAGVLRDGLSEEGFSVVLAGRGEDALSYCASAIFDLIVLDVNLPGIDGFSVARELRQNGNRTPVLILTARDSLQDVVKGLNLGADDYLAKPFSFEVLLARLRAIGRRGMIAVPVVLGVSDLQMDTESRLVSRAGQKIPLTTTEYSLLELLLRNAGRNLPRQTILDTVWGFNTDIEVNTLEAFVRSLRAKVDVPFAKKLIHTIRGVGYSIRSPEL